jgi:hypothetical protein
MGVKRRDNSKYGILLPIRKMLAIINRAKGRYGQVIVGDA